MKKGARGGEGGRYLRLVGHHEEAEAAGSHALSFVAAVRAPLDGRDREHAADGEQHRRLAEQAQQLRARALAQLVPGPGLHPRDRDLGRPHLEVAGLGGGGRVAPVVGEERDDLLLRQVLLDLVALEEAVPVVELHVRLQHPHEFVAIAVAHVPSAAPVPLVVDRAQPRHADAPPDPAPAHRVGRHRDGFGGRTCDLGGRDGDEVAVEVSALLDVEEDHAVDARFVDLLLRHLRHLQLPHDAEGAEDDAEREEQHAEHGVAEDEAAGVVVGAGLAVVRDEEVQVVADALAVEGRDRHDRHRRVDQEQERPDDLPVLVEAVAQVRAVEDPQDGERGREQRADEDGRDGVHEEDVLVGRADVDARDEGQVREAEAEDGGAVEK
eukprot:979420-Rhodomonas_salina.1